MHQTWQHGMQMPAAASAPVATLPGKGAEKATKICEHGRRRNRCKDCGDVVICVHGKTKYSCKVIIWPLSCQPEISSSNDTAGTA